MTPSGPIPASETAAFVKLNTNSLTWEVLQLVAGNGSNAVNVALTGSGAFALARKASHEEINDRYRDDEK
jgi:hypothetical protein